MPASHRPTRDAIVAALVLVPAAALPALADDDDPQLAVVADSTVSVVLRGAFGDLSLERGELSSGKARPSTPLGDQEVSFRRGFRHPHRWRIGQGAYWGVATTGNRGGFGGGGFRRVAFQPPSAEIVRVPLDDIRRGAGTPTARPVAGAGADGVAAGPGLRVGPAEPLSTAIARAVITRSGPVHYDLVPTGTNACRLYLILDGQLEAWDYRFHRGSNDAGAVSGWWKEVSRSPLEWNEPFLALPDGNEGLFLATSSGELWDASPKLDVPKRVWSDPSRPVRWVVVDAARSRAYAVGRSFSFLINPDPQAFPLPASASPTTGDTLADALRVSRAVLAAP